MKFEDISFYVTIGIAIINITGALRKVAKIKKEEPLYKIYEEILDRKSTRLNSSHMSESRMPSSA